jgi:putative PEP-CTERM system integral membrane protein
MLMLRFHEVYKTKTPEQEVVYYFSLPSRRLTGSGWASSAREGRSTFRVSPRGAAQQVYVEQVQQRVDPALLEQVGPRQYRLRVFPIEPARWSSSGASRENFKRTGPELHLWMTWRVLAQDRVLPLAQLTEHRNVYWDARSAREINGKRYAGDDWMPASVPDGGDLAGGFRERPDRHCGAQTDERAPALQGSRRCRGPFAQHARSRRRGDAAIARLRGVRAQGAA